MKEKNRTLLGYLIIISFFIIYVMLYNSHKLVFAITDNQVLSEVVTFILVIIEKRWFFILIGLIFLLVAAIGVIPLTNVRKFKKKELFYSILTVLFASVIGVFIIYQGLASYTSDLNSYIKGETKEKYVTFIDGAYTDPHKRREYVYVLDQDRVKYINYYSYMDIKKNQPYKITYLPNSKYIIKVIKIDEPVNNCSCSIDKKENK